MRKQSPSLRSRTALIIIISIIALVGGWVYRPSHSAETAGLPARPASVNLVPAQFGVAGFQFEVRHPDTYQLELLIANLRSPRLIHFHGDRLFMGSKSGMVYWADPPYSQINTIARLDNYPHSIVVRGHTIYVARTDGVYSAPYAQETPWIAAQQFKRYIALPGGRGHNSRTLKIGPDKKLYVSLGIRGNCSDAYLDPSYPANSRRGGVFLIDESGPSPRLIPFASGLRNPVGFDWHPHTGVMYASNNGPDHRGFNQPPEYFARLTPGSFHGMPWYQYDGEKLLRDECIQSNPPRAPNQVSIPVATFPARNAPMDVAFITENANASEYAGDAIVALHGSWGTADGGYADGDPATRRHPKLVLVKFNNGVATGVEDLLTGFQLADGKRWARPVGVAVGSDGDIYFTSDAAIHGLFRLRKLYDGKP